MITDEVPDSGFAIYSKESGFVAMTLDTMSDEELVTRSKAGDQNAFSTLFLRYKIEVYSCVKTMVQNDVVTEDLWHDAYPKAWGHIQDLKEPSRFKFWLLTIAKRLAFDWLRKDGGIQTSPWEESGSPSDPIDHKTDAQVMIESVIARELVISIQAQMEPVYREILISTARGFSPAEIATKLGYKEGTITTYLSLARKQFRELYHKMNEN